VKRRLLVLFAVLAIVATACGDDDDDNASSATTAGTTAAATTAATTGGTQAAPSPTAATTASTAPPQNFDPAGVIRYATKLDGSGSSGRLLPSLSTSVCDFGIMDGIYSTIIHKNGTTGNLEPELAEKWEAPDPQTFRFTLRSGLKFSDGTPLDAAAAVAGLTAIKSSQTASVNAAYAQVDTITAVDNTTVEIKFKTPVAGTFAYTLAGREGMIAAASSTDTAPVGAGPFKFASQQPGADIKLEKYADYWNAANIHLGGVEFVNVESGPPQANALLAGDAEMFLGDATTYPLVNGKPGITVAQQPGNSYYKLSLKLDDVQLSNLAFRQAMNYAIDRDAIVKTVLAGLAEPAWQPYNSTFFGHDPAADNLYPHDVAKAKAKLAEAGFANGATVQMFKPSGVPVFDKIADVVTANLAEVGITLDLQPSTDIVKEYLTDHLRPGSLTLWPARPDPSVTIYNQWTLGPPVPPQNTGAYSDPVLTNGVVAVRSTTDPAAQQKTYKEMSNFVATNALDVPLAFGALITPYNSDKVLGQLEQYENCQDVNFRTLSIKK
jgi:ABC-type transport system substrate-binding protein